MGSGIKEELTSAQEAKTKVKTRSDKPVEKFLEKLTISEKENVEASKLNIAVGKRPLEILQALYPKPNYEERIKNVDWASFVYAMAEAGFVAKQLHGSEYSFEPVPSCTWHERGRIIFHKPHQEPKYEAWKLLNIRKRMEKWFDWNADTFELLDSKAGVQKA